MDESKKFEATISFNDFWGGESVKHDDIDVVMDKILTGRTVFEVTPDFWVFPVFGRKDKPRHILDFGCGIGRNTFALAEYSKNWIVAGYDNLSMISRTEEYRKLKYDKDIPNAIFSSDWNAIKKMDFGAVFACIVFQHIHEEPLIQYLNDIKNMTKILVVHGRQFNDDNNKNTWKILESQGLFPIISLSVDHVGRCLIHEYNPEDEHPESHRINIYSL